MTQKNPYCTSDIIVGLTIPIEFFQYSSMGPNVNILSNFISVAGSTLNSDWEKIMDIRDGVFWIIVYDIYALVGIWIIFVLLHTCRFYKKFPNNNFLGLIK